MQTKNNLLFSTSDKNGKVSVYFWDGTQARITGEIL